MGEKGNLMDAGAAAAGGLIERVTTTATETVTGVGQDFLETVKDKSVGAVADNTIAAARDKLRRAPGDAAAVDDTESATGPGGATGADPSSPDRS